MRTRPNHHSLRCSVYGFFNIQPNTVPQLRLVNTIGMLIYKLEGAITAPAIGKLLDDFNATTLAVCGPALNKDHLVIRYSPCARARLHWTSGSRDR